MKVPILMYHQITARPLPGYTRYAVTPSQFARQMRWLSLRGCTTVSLDTLLRCRAGGIPWPCRPIVITIDDGYAEAARHAMEVLPKFGFTATVFLVAGAMGGGSTWVQGVSIPVMRWETAREMMKAGFSCGSHSVTHARLATLSPTACTRELRDSRQRLEDGLGAAVTDFAYPYGSVNDTVRQLAAEEGYSNACGITLELSADGDDPLRLPRVPVMGDDSLADFACRLRTARPVGAMLRVGLRGLLAAHAHPLFQRSRRP